MIRGVVTRRLWTAVAMMVAAANIDAANVAVRVTAAPGAETCRSSGVLTVHRAGASAEQRIDIPRSGVATIALADGADATVRIGADGCWSETLDLVPPFASEYTLLVRRATHVRSSIETPRGATPQSLQARVFAPPEQSANPLTTTEAGHPLDCTLHELGWDCVAPADVAFDLRLDSAGFAPVHYWSVVARAGAALTLEPRPMVHGASVSGWVEGPDGKPLANAQLALSPAAVALGEEARVASRAAATRTNRRGFFQFSGIAGGEYRLVSRADGLSPVLLPVLNVRDGENLTWPRAIRHLQYAQLELRLTPPSSADGKPWVVSLEERIPLTDVMQPPLRKAAQADGVWRAEKLRADAYSAAVADSNGAVLERFSVDLSNSGLTTIPLTIHRIAIRGVLRFGDEPLKARIRFAQNNGRSLVVDTNVLGEFAAAFPAAGRWTPTIYPHGDDGPKITAKPVIVPETADADAIEIRLPGGRIRGTVVNGSDAPEKAAVHVAAKGALAAQVITGDDGTFDLIGIEEGEYEVDAEGMSGSSMPEATHVAAGEATELRIRLEKSHTFAATIVTPSGMPASGALVRSSRDGGATWSEQFTGVDGRFEYDASTMRPLLLAVITNTYPVLIAELSPQEKNAPAFMLQPRGGLLRAKSRAFVSRGGMRAAMEMLFTPGTPGGAYNGAAYLEPGVYSVCTKQFGSADCREVSIQPGSEETVDLRAKAAENAR
jgi:hypothetical protein